MPERTPAFEAYLKGLENKVNAPAKGKPAREGRLIVSPDELSDEENPDLDSSASKKSPDDDQEDAAI